MQILHNLSLRTADKEVDDLDHDLSDLSEVSNSSIKVERAWEEGGMRTNKGGADRQTTKTFVAFPHGKRGKYECGVEFLPHAFVS